MPPANMNGDRAMGRNSGLGWFQLPQPPSPEGICRNPQNGRGSRSLPDPNHDGTHRVRFPLEEDEEDSGPLAILGNIATAILISICAAGLATILTVLWVAVRPFSQPVYRRLAAQLGAASFLDAAALLLPNTRIYLTGDSDVPAQLGTSLMVSNHLVDGDWWAMFMLGRCVGLGGSMKMFLRNEFLQIDMNEMKNGEHQFMRASSSNGALARSTSSSVIVSSSRSENGSANTNNTTSSVHQKSSAPDLALLAKLLHIFLEFPLVNGDEYVADREQLFKLLRSFAANRGSAAPVHLLFFPEEWTLHNGADRRSLLAKSNEFAKREGRPQLKHLLLPRTRGFYASLECLRESSPVVYDVTMAYSGYDGSLPISMKLSVVTLWDLFRRRFPKEVHLRIKRYSMEEVFQDSSWLDKKWAEKDRLLTYFAKHQSFPVDSRGFCRHRTFDTRYHSMESSTISFVRLLLLPCAVPVLLLLSMPLLCTVFWIWLAHYLFRLVFPDPDAQSSVDGEGDGNPGEAGQTPGSASSAAGTPYFPATPFASPSITNWRDVLSNRGNSPS
jgi:hypothetical protein